MSTHDHDHDHDSELSEMQLLVRALETVLAEKGYIDPAALDLIVEQYETRIGPQNGARVVAKAWTDPEFKKALEARSLEVKTMTPEELGAFMERDDEKFRVLIQKLGLKAE